MSEFSSQVVKVFKVGQDVQLKDYTRNIDKTQVVLEVKSNGITLGTEISRFKYEEMRRKRAFVSTVELNGKYYTQGFHVFQKVLKDDIYQSMNISQNKLEWIAHENSGVVVNPDINFEIGKIWKEITVK